MGTAMSDRDALLAVLRRSADGAAADVIAAMIESKPDRALVRVNALQVAKETGVGEERMIAAFLHAARIGLFDLSWNVLCPGCGGVLDATATLKSIDRSEYQCALCSAGYEPNLD